jgi:hypothetical protein
LLFASEINQTIASYQSRWKSGLLPSRDRGKPAEAGHYKQEKIA